MYNKKFSTILIVLSIFQSSFSFHHFEKTSSNTSLFVYLLLYYFLFQNFSFSQPYLSLTHTLIIYLSFTMLYIPMHILNTITCHLQQKIYHNTNCSTYFSTSLSFHHFEKTSIDFVRNFQS